MSDLKDNLGYLGNVFQQKLLWQLLTNQKFGENVIPYLDSKYFDDGYFKRLIILIKNYLEKNRKVPSIKNSSIHEVINEINIDETERETLLAVIKKIETWESDVLRGAIPFDGNIVQEKIYEFIKQQEFKSLGTYIVERVKDGKIDDSFNSDVDEKIKLINKVGIRDERGIDPFTNIDSNLDDDYREVIPTGISKIDELMGGGLGKKELGLILAAPGTGKSTILTKIANTAINHKKNVLQIIFEDTYKEIIRKHYSIWSEVPLSDFKDSKELIKKKVLQVQTNPNLGKLVLVRFPEEGVTIPSIKRWIIEFQIETGIIFDEIVLDYIDCVESDRRMKDKLDEEMRVIKSMIVLLDELDIPGWSAVQSNRSGAVSEFINSSQIAGNFKRTHKVHFFMSISKTPEQRRHGRANVQILKSRFASDGQQFEDIIFDNNKMSIIITDKPQKNYQGGTGHTFTQEIKPDDFSINIDLLKQLDEFSDVTIVENKKIESEIIENLNDEEEYDPLKEALANI